MRLNNDSKLKYLVTAALLVSVGCGADAPGEMFDPGDQNPNDPGVVDNGNGGAGGNAGAGGDGGMPPVMFPPELASVTEMRPELLLTGERDGFVWGAGGDDLYHAMDGMVAHYDGERWEPLALTEDVNDALRKTECMFGLPPANLYLCGGNGDIVHFDGTEWSVADLGYLSFVSIHGTSTDNLYGVSRSRVHHFDGTAWSEVETGLPSGFRWESVSVSGNEVFLAGRGASAPWPAAFAHFDGTSWQVIDVPGDETRTLWSVWSPGPGLAFAAGGDGVRRFANGQLTLLEGSPPSSGLWGVSSTEVFASSGRSLYRFNGATWTDIAPDADDVSFDSIFGFGGNDLYAVGEGVRHFDGLGWDTLLPYIQSVEGIWSDDADNWMVLGAPTYRFDGEKLVAEDLSEVGVYALNDAWGTPERLFAVGSGGAIVLYEDGEWGRMTSNTTARLTSVWGASDDDVYAVGHDGQISHFNGSTWGAVPSGTLNTLRGVWGTDSNDIYAVGHHSTVLHFDGTEWSPMDAGTDVHFSGVVGFGPEDLFLHSNAGIHLGNGLTWRRQEVDFLGYTTDVEAMDGTTPNNVFGAEYNWFAHFDGETWTSIARGPQSGTAALEALDDRDVVVAWNSAVLRYRAD